MCFWLVGWDVLVVGEHQRLEVARRALAEGAVSAVRVVEGLDVIEGHEFRSGAGGREGVGEAFGQRVVVRVACAAHAQGDAVRGGEPGKVGGGVLAAAVAVMEQAGRRRMALQCEGEGRGGEFSAHGATLNQAILAEISDEWLSSKIHLDSMRCQNLKPAHCFPPASRRRTSPIAACQVFFRKRRKSHAAPARSVAAVPSQR